MMISDMVNSRVLLLLCVDMCCCVVTRYLFVTASGAPQMNVGDIVWSGTTSFDEPFITAPSCLFHT